MTSKQVRLSALILTAVSLFGYAVIAAPMKSHLAVGQKAKDFTLKDLDERENSLSKLTAQGPVVLVVLRGFPGYQCPICTKQVGSILGRAKEFDDAKAQVVLVYPGKADGLDQHAEEFIRGNDFPANVHFVTDPDYKFTKLYNLRWNAEGETAYPTSLVIAPDMTIKYSLVSEHHGGRANTEDLLAALK